MFRPERTALVLNDVDIERTRQEKLCAAGKFPFTCAANYYRHYVTPEDRDIYLDQKVSQSDKLAILAEEFGEVARHVTEQIIDPQRLQKDKLRAELIQVAAVAVAWAESLET